MEDRGHGKKDGHEAATDAGHVVPVAIFMKVFVALLIFTAITVAASRVNFGVFNLVIAMVIASIKAGIVALFFMHLKYEHPLTWAYVAFPIVLLLIMLGGIFIDNPLRIVP